MFLEYCPRNTSLRVLFATEQCDDGNLVDGDGCGSNCTLTAYGNGIVAAVKTAGLTARGRVARNCTDAGLATMAPCASTVDGIITAAGDTGCMVAPASAAVDAMLAAEYGRLTP